MFATKKVLNSACTFSYRCFGFLCFLPFDVRLEIYVIFKIQGELPLDEELKRQLRKNITSLSELIDANSGIVENLWSRGAISGREQQHLNSIKVGSDKSLELLNLIIAKSDRTYTWFLEALKETNQGHIIEYLQNGRT